MFKNEMKTLTSVFSPLDASLYPVSVSLCGLQCPERLFPQHGAAAQSSWWFNGPNGVVDTTRATVVVVCRISRGGKCVNTRV